MIRFNLSLATCLVCLVISCKEHDPAVDTPDWTAESHGNETAPHYDEVFPQDRLNTIEIRMMSQDWQTIKADLTTKLGSDFGAGMKFDTTRHGTGPGNMDTTSVKPGGNEIKDADFFNSDPKYVSVSMTYGGKEWPKVGFRLKGNSSLALGWQTGNYKLPFRLNFDKFEDQYPQIKNQRFYGFKELSFSSGISDNSLIREKSAADIFRMAGIASAKTAFYKVYVDLGDGLKYFGVYTAVEVIDDTMVKNQLGHDRGNIYKPESTFESFTQSQFAKKNNKAQNDYSDVQATIATLHSKERTSNPAAWRANLEKTFNVDYFMKWLAVNRVMKNWDAYGLMAHNYYLYNLPGKGLTWIPWDNNDAMKGGGEGASSVGGDTEGGANEMEQRLSLSEVKKTWPLIRYLADDPVYFQRYKTYMKAFNDEVFTHSRMSELFDRYSNLISPQVTGPQAVEQPNYGYTTASDFKQGLVDLKAHVRERNEAVKTFLK